MEFKQKLKQRLYIAVSYIVLGVILIAADMLNHFDNYFLLPFGIALLVMGFVRMVRYWRIAKDEKSIRKQELAENDERMRMLSERAKSWAFSFSIMAGGIAVIILSLLGYHDPALPFAWFVCGQACLYWICWNIVRKKY